MYAVPDESVGDQLMAAVTTLATLDPAGFEAFLAAQPDLSPKAWPRYVRIVDALPRTATNKVLKRQLSAEGPVSADGALWTREARGTAYEASSLVE